MYYVWQKCLIYLCRASELSKFNDVDYRKLWIGLRHSDNIWKWEFENTDEVEWSRFIACKTLKDLLS